MRISLLVGVVLPLIACGSLKTGSSGGATLPAIDDLVDAVDAARCNALVSCHEISDVALCHALLGPPGTGFNSLASSVASVKAGKATYDAAAARACLDAIAGQCELMVVIQGRLQPEPCTRIFTGEVADGERCVADAECMAGSFCGMLPIRGCDGTCTRGGTMCNNDTHCNAGQVCDQVHRTDLSAGTCAAPVAGGESEPCGTNLSCSAGLYCKYNNNGPSTCARFVQMNDACDNDRCAEGLLCAGADDGSSTPHCLPPAGKGEPCQGSEQCGAVVSTLVCDPTTQKCVDAPTTGPCFGARLICNPLTSYCNVVGPASYMCTPYQALGSSCTPSGDPCGLLGFCSTASLTDVVGTCQLRFPDDTCSP